VTTTFFKGVDAIRPGWCYTITPEGIDYDTMYWNKKNIKAQNNNLSFEDCTTVVRQKLISIVGNRLRSDIPVAFCQSGGIDSSSLISIAKKNYEYDVHGFTIVGKDGRYDESENVKYISKALGIKNHQVRLSTRGFINNLEEITKDHFSPLSTISYYVHWLLMKEVNAKGFRVCISGTGGDELFSGYYDHYHYFLYETRWQDFNKVEFDYWRKEVLPMIRNSTLQDFSLFQNNPYFRDYLYDDAYCKKFLNDDWRDIFIENKFCGDILRNRMNNELFHEVVPPVLHDDDLNSMYFSIENRSPFLEHKLFDFVSTIPTKYLILHGYNKAILRNAMAGIVPDRILSDRRKTGFNAAIEDLFDFTDKNQLRWLFRGSSIWDIVSRDDVQELVTKEHFSNIESKFLFRLMSTKIFLDAFE